MGFKRKFDIDDEPVAIFTDRPIKHARVMAGHVVSPPACEDVAMDDSCSESYSVSAGSATESPTAYPTFDLYPFPSTDIDMEGVNQTFIVATVESRTSSNASEEGKPAVVGLMQPKSSFHHNEYVSSPNVCVIISVADNVVTQSSKCTTIPRLRVACEAGLGGARTLWTQ
ncbi:hypothetical protein M422DRAFT_45008 [Sphaerobolus stellatus SS14]|nr:hypothetical protein M422DRAFT_45008 [Sphaerobolus stellatus SS14]